MNDKIIYIHRDKNLVIDVFQWQPGKELELIKFGVECKFTNGIVYLLDIGPDRTYTPIHGDYILKMQGNESFKGNRHFYYFVLPENEFNEHVKKYSLKLIEKDSIKHPSTLMQVCEICGEICVGITEVKNKLCFVCEKATGFIKKGQDLQYDKSPIIIIPKYCKMDDCTNEAIDGGYCNKHNEFI